MNLKVMTVLAGAPFGGAETFFTSLTTAFAQAGFEVRSVLKANPGRETALDQSRINYATAPFSAPFDWTTRAVIRRNAAEFRPDVILAFAGRAARFIPRGPYKVVGRLGGYYNLANFRQCDHLVCNSPSVLRHVVEKGWPAAGVTVIPNFPSIAESRAANRADLATPDSAPLAVALGRLHRNKGLDLLIRAASNIPELFVWIAGEGPERANLEQLSRELQVSGRVRFLGWRSDRGALYAAADICVYPSREEPFGNVVVEAWSCGTPLITTGTAGPAWLVRDNEDALLVPVENIGALTTAIRSLLNSRELRERLAVAGKRRVAEEFSEPAIVRRYAETFRGLMV
jgi:glycosyltransferase involved in cell wall biosynthesis